jgi:hypothetical protein
MMATNIPYESQVEDSVPKIDNDIAVGEDLEFQRKWWRFEKIIWPILLLVVLIDLLGGLGRGWLSKTQRSTPDHAFIFDYERIERASTPSIMTLHFGSQATRGGHIVVHVSDSVVQRLGAQRVSPQPAVSALGNGGITYVFPSNGSPADAQIELQPSFPGLHQFRIQVEGSTPIEGTIAVLP